MLENPFLVPSLCKLNHIELCFIRISAKSPAKLLFSIRESTLFFFFEVIPGVFRRSVNFNITKISIKKAHVSRLSVSCDYDYNQICKWLYVNTVKTYQCLYSSDVSLTQFFTLYSHKCHTVSRL